MEGPKYQVYRDKNLLDRFRLISADGEVLLLSEPFTARHLAEIGIYSCQKLTMDPMNYIKRDTVHNKYYFVLKKLDQNIIGTSLIYGSPIERDEKIRACMEYGSVEKIERLIKTIS